MSTRKTAAVKEELGYEDAISQGVEWCLELKRPSSAVITDDVLDGLSPEAFRAFARHGWLDKVNNRLGFERNRACRPAKAARPGSHPAMGRNPSGAWKPLDIPMQGADGALKRLASFDLEDLEHLRTEALGKEQGWRRRRVWTERARKLVKAHASAERIEQLPKSQVEELSKLAREAWS